MPGQAYTNNTGDGRAAARHRTLLGGKLVYGEGAFSVDVMVRDLSGAGAKVKLPEGQGVPDELWMIDLHSGVAYEANVAWKRHPHIGLNFSSRHDLETEATTPLLKLMKRFWAESRQRSGVS